MIVDYLYNLSLQIPDLLIMLLCAIAIGGLGVFIAQAAYSIWWKRHASDRDPSRDAGDGVHNSILALIAFLMALITTSELTSFANADKQITLEGVALNTRWMFEPVQGFVGRPIEALTLIGGGAASDVWCQIFADTLGVLGGESSILTGPGWKNFSGVITPSFLNTIPFFITNCTSRNASMSVRGFPFTAIRSA